jgi:hypothetical protein
MVQECHVSNYNNGCSVKEQSHKMDIFFKPFKLKQKFLRVRLLM